MFYENFSLLLPLNLSLSLSLTLSPSLSLFISVSFYLSISLSLSLCHSLSVSLHIFISYIILILSPSLSLCCPLYRIIHHPLFPLPCYGGQTHFNPTALNFFLLTSRGPNILCPSMSVKAGHVCLTLMNCSIIMFSR